MGNAVQDALKEREERKKKEREEALAKQKAMADEVTSALNDRDIRIQSTLENDVEDFYNRVSKEISTYKSITTSSSEVRDLKKLLDDTRENRVNIGNLRQELDVYKKYLTEDAYQSYVSALDGLKQGYDSYLRLDIDPVIHSDDFDEYSQKGAAIKNPTMQEAEGWLSVGDWRLFGKDIGNIVTYSRENEMELRAGAANNTNMLGDYLYSHMTDDEVGIYNYYLAKYGDEKASEYLDSIYDNLAKIEAGEIAKRVDGTYLEGIMSFSSGLENFAYGIKNLDNYVTGTDPDQMSQFQYANSIMQENNEGIWGVTNDLLYTGGNMLPSILVGSFTGGLGGSLTMGASTMGNAYAQMRNLGYDEWQSRGYGFLVGASEATLQYFLGGISKLGGKATGNAVGNLLSKVDNAFARTAIKLGSSMASEGLEEAIQTALEPAFKALVTGEQFEAAEWDEILYSALLGALSAGVMEGVPTIAGEVNVRNQGANLKASGIENVTSLADLGKTFADDTVANRLGNKVNENSSAYQVGRLLEEVGGSLSERNIADVASDLQAKGMSPEEAMKTAQWLYKAAEGGTYTRKQQKAYLEDERISDVHRDLFTNEEHSINKRNAEYDALYALAQEATKPNSKTTSKDVPSQAEASAQQAETVSVTKNPIEGEVATETKFEASTDGKTRVGDMEVSIKEIASVKDGKITIRLEDGSTVNAEDVEFSSTDEGLLYENVAHMGLNAATANAFVKGYEPSMSVQEYALGFREAYRYGEYGFPVQEMSADGFSAKLSESQKSLAYNIGKTDAKYKISEKQAKVTEKVSATVSKKEQVGATKGKLHNTIKPTTERQKASLKALGFVAKTLGIDIYTFESAVVDGKRQGANGWYDPSDNSIHIDIHAGLNGEGTMLFTAAHELTHFIREWSPAKFKVFADFLLEQYGKKGVSVDALVREQIEKAKRNGRDISYDTAYEEVIADSCEAMLADGDAIAKIAELKAKDKTLWQKIKDYLTNLVARIKAAYKGLSPDSVEGNHVAEMLDTAERLKALWTEALVDASDTYNASKEHSDVIEKDLANKDVLFNLRATESHKNKLEEQYSSAASVNLDTLMKRYEKIISVWKKLGGELNSKFLTEWNNKIGKDRAFTVFKAQAGYKYNVELSSMCKKGVPLFEAIDTIVKNEVMKELDTEVLGKEEKEILYDILKAHDFEIPCAICYVEQARQREGVIIDAFLNGKVEKNSKGQITTFKLGWNEVLKDVEKEMKASGVDYSFKAVDRSIATDKYVPQDLTMDSATQEAFYNALKKVANKEITRYNKAEGKSRKLVTSVTPSAIKEVFKGTLPSNLKIFKVLFTEPSSRFTLESDLPYSSMTTHNLATAHNALYSLFNSQGGVSGYKTKQGTVVYWGDILGKKWSPSKVRDEGGIRNQSNSDFQMYTLLDQAQMYIDFTAKGYYLQAYTKVLSELKLFGLSRGKINASLIPAVYEYRNADGSADVETTRLYAGLDKNGNLLFDDIEGINHNEAFMLLEDAEYSKSIGGICIGYSDNHILKLLDDSRVQQIIGFHDKTDDPTKRYRGARYAKNYNGLNEAVNNKDGKTVHIGFNPYVRKAEKMFSFNSKTETYEGEIEYNGKTYVADDIPKLAADLYLEMCEKKGYTPAYTDFDFHENYYKLLADFSLYDSQGHYAPHRKVAYNMPDKVPYLDLNGNKKYMATEDYIKSELEKELKVRDSISEALADTSENGIIPQFKKRVNELHKETKLSDRDSTYMEAVNRGDMDTAQRMVDEAARDAGYTIKAYHGTNADFTVFDKNRVGKGNDQYGAGFYFASNPDVTEGYGAKRYDTYLNIKKPINLISKPGGEGKTLYDVRITQAQAYQILKRHPLMYDSENSPLGDFYDKYWEVGAKEWMVRDLAKKYDSIGFLDGDAILYRDYPNELHEAIRDVLGYDGVQVYFETEAMVDERNDYFYVAWFDNQMKSSDPVVRDDKGNIIPLSQRFNTENNDIRYSDRDHDSVSNRSLLANALEGVAQNDIERKKLGEYKNKIALIESEQAKLAEVRAKIKELSFAKGARDTEAIKKLQFEANQTANRINTYDRQLLNLESTKALKDVLEREKKMAYKKAEQRGKDALADYRERATKTQRELMDRYQESRKKGVENRKKTEMRHKIKDVVGELNQYLLKGTKDKHVPIELQKAVAEALDAVNMDTVGAEERLAKIHDQLSKDPFNHKLLESYKRIADQGERMDEKLQSLKNAYDSIINSDDPIIANSHDEVISNSIAHVIDEVGDTPLRDMSLYQLESVYDMYRMVLHSIRAANKAFKAEKGKEISVLANTVISDLDGKKRNPLNLADTSFAWNNLKPVYAFERIGSNTFTKLFNAVREGEDVWAMDMSEAQAFREEQSQKYKFDSWDFEKKYPFNTHRGTPFELDLGEMMSIYAFAKDEHSKGHLIGEGFVFDPKKEVVENVKGKIKVKVNLEDATSYNLSEEIVADIISKLTPEQKAFADAMQDYLSTTMGEKGNEVSLELYGIKLFKSKNYFPLKVAPQYMAVAKEKAQGDVKIKNKGFTKDRKDGATNPIVLSSFMDVWADHVNEMSMYHAFTLPLEDFYRVFNYKTPRMEGYAPMSVNASIENAFGKGATQYIDQLLKDLNGGARVDNTVGIINKLTGLFKKSAVFASVSVVVQQPSAIARATALVDTKYFVGKPSKSKHKETWAEVKKYAPVAIIKEMGYFDTGMGQSSVEWLKGDKTWRDKLDDIASKAPALADELAWCTIWNAVKRETLHTHKDLKPNSEEFLKAVGERFTEVITKTQVYDSVLSRSANMRSKDTGMKMATAFMGEPTTSINMLQDALTQGKRGNKRYARKAVGSVVASMILNSILVSFVYAGRDDDEEKTYAEKYVGSLTEELIDSINPLTLIPFVKDIVSIAQGYDVERSDMAVITDIINAWNNLSNDNRSAYRKVEDFAGAIASLIGLPVKNIMRDARGMYNTINSFVSGEKTTAAGIKNAIGEAVTGDSKSNGQQLYEAMVSGDPTQIERVKSRFKDQKAIDSAIRTALRENDSRIKEAAEARYNGDIAEYMRIAKAIIAEGNFSQDNIVSAINSEINALKKGEGTSESTESSNKVKSIYEIGDYYASVVGRDQATAYAVKEDIIKTDVANGKDREEAEADFNYKFARHLQDEYEAGNLSDYEAQNMLVNYGGKSEEEASSKVQYWDFKKNYPDYDLTEDAVKKYYAEVESSGISVGVYYDYSKQRSKCKGTDADGDGKTDSGSVKYEVMQVINSLPITSYQKDVLYYLNGWSAKTIWEAPWR